MIRRSLALIVLSLASAPLAAWQLQALSLQERVQQSSLIVTGTPLTVLERKPSLVAGLGDELLVQLRVAKVLKGEAPEAIRIRFNEAAVQTPPGFVVDSARLWLLTEGKKGEFLAPSHFTSVLDSSTAIADYLNAEESSRPR